MGQLNACVSLLRPLHGQDFCLRVSGATVRALACLLHGISFRPEHADCAKVLFPFNAVVGVFKNVEHDSFGTK